MSHYLKQSNVIYLSGLLLFSILYTNEIGVLTGVDDFYIQFASAILFVISTLKFISTDFLSFKSRHLFFILLLLIFFIHFLFQNNDDISTRKFIETVGVYSVLVYCFTLRVEFQEKILIALIKMTLLYQLVLFGFYLHSFSVGLLDIVSRSGAVSDSYHRVGRMVTVGMVGYLALMLFESNTYKPQPIFIIACLVAPLNLLFSANRMGLVALALCLIYLFFNSTLKKNLVSIIVVVIAISGLIIFVGDTFYMSKIFYSFQRFSGILDGSSNSFERLDMYKSAIDVGIENFPFGAGYGLWSFESGFINRHPHNIILELFAEVGIAVVLFIYIIVDGYFRSPKWKRAIILGLLAQAFVGGDFSDNRQLMYFLVL